MSKLKRKNRKLAKKESSGYKAGSKDTRIEFETKMSEQKKTSDSLLKQRNNYYINKINNLNTTHKRAEDKSKELLTQEKRSRKNEAKQAEKKYKSEYDTKVKRHKKLLKKKIKNLRKHKKEVFAKKKIVESDYAGLVKSLKEVGEYYAYTGPTRKQLMNALGVVQDMENEFTRLMYKINKNLLTQAKRED